MPTPASLVDRFARRLAPAASDRDLVALFRETADQQAFARLVERHGPMVLGVCRRALRDAHAAEDAFQAVFLVLSRKLGSVAWHESLAGWLYQVARHVCRKAQARTARDAAHPLPADGPPTSSPDPSNGPTVADLKAVLDDELGKLPTRHRDAIVLCHLEGRTADEAAAILGCTDGQLRGWLHRGRERLRERLARRGIELGGAALALALSQATAGAVPAAVVAAAARAAATPDLLQAASPTVVTLTQGVLQAMSPTKFRLAVLCAVLLGGATAGTVWVRPAAADPVVPVARKPADPLPPAPAAKADDDKKPEEKVQVLDGKVHSVDAAAKTFVVALDDGGSQLNPDATAGAAVFVARRKAAVADLRPGMRVRLHFRGQERAAFKAEAGWPGVRTKLTSADAAKRTVAFRLDDDDRVDLDATLPVLADAAVTLDGIPVTLADVPTGRELDLELGADKKSVAAVVAHSAKDELPAVVVAADSQTLRVQVEASGNDVERRLELSFAVDPAAKVRHAGKDIKAADLKAGMPVVVRFAADRRTVVAVWAGDPRPVEKDDD